MASLTGTKVSDTYQQLLKLTSQGVGADASAKYIEDGLGTDTALSLSTTRVGIGTASPSEIFHVQGTGVTDRFARFESTDFDMFLYIDADSGASNSDADTGIIFRNNNSEDFRIGVDETDSSFHVATGSFGSAGTKKLTINSSGNVGIGVSPTTKFEVQDGNGIPLRFGDVASTPSATAGYIGMSTSAYSGNNGDLVLIPRTSASSNILLMEANVGIGTTSPNAPLQFSNDADTRKIVLYEGANNDYQFYGFGIEGSTLVYSTYTTSDDHVFFAGTGTSSRNELMRIGGDGNVGIGTDNPDTLLTLEKSLADNTFIKLSNKDTGGDLSQQKSFIDFDFVDANANFTPQVRIGAEVGENSDANAISKEGSGAFVVYTAEGTDEAGNGSLTEKLRVDYLGNVGINQTLPDAKLHIKGVAKIVNIESTSATGRCYIMFEDPSSDKGFIGYGSSQNDVLAVYNYKNNGLQFGAGGAEVMSIDTSGNVTPTGSLYLAGGSTGRILFNSQKAIEGTTNNTLLNLGEDYLDVRVRANCIPDGNNTRNLGSTSDRWSVLYTSNAVNVSDRTTKTEIADCDLGTDFIKTLQPKSYKMADLPEEHDDYDRKHYGLIAQDLIDTELNDSVFGKQDGEYSLAYNDLIAPMIKAIQELTARLDDLEPEEPEQEQSPTVKERVNSLEARVNDLENG